jgi:hypothetical protein
MRKSEDDISQTLNLPTDAKYAQVIENIVIQSRIYTYLEAPGEDINTVTAQTLKA